VRDPGRNIPRSLVISIIAVACLYLMMNISVLGIVPWQEMSHAADTGERTYVISTMMQRLYGHWAGGLASVLIMWTAFASVVSLMLSVSRVPFAAARDGNYFRAFAHINAAKQFPDFSLAALALVTLLFCTLRLQDLIAALVIIRIVVQFVAQTVGVMLLRRTRPDLHRPFRIWLYPLPPILATLGFLYVLIERPNAAKEIRYAAVLVTVGIIIYLVRAYHRREWPFQLIPDSTPPRP
jgi:basic amino acid/polyamine antiporter, APA family